MAGILDLMGYIQDQGDRGRAQGLAKLVGSAYTAPPEQRQQILGTVAARGGLDMAANAQTHFDKLDESARTKLGQYAVAFDALPDDQKAQAYPMFAQQAQQLGLPAPPQWDPAFAPNIQKLAQALGAAGATPEVRTFNTFAQGLSADDLAKARRIQLGLDSRAVGAANKSITVDIGGVPTTLTFDPVTGSYSPAVIGGASQAAPATGGPSAGGDIFSGLDSAAPGLTVTSGPRTPEHNREVGGVPNSYHLTGQARDILPPNPQQAPAVRQWAAQHGMEVIPEGDHWHLEPRPGSPIVGRTKEAEAAAVEAAKNRVNLDMLPEQGRLEADNAGIKAAAEVAGKSGAEAQFNLPKVEQSANAMLTTIRDLKSDPALKSIVGLNGKFNPSVYIPGTPEQRALTRIRQINGQAFLQAYQTLRGGGQITEVEGQKATEAMGRLDRAQSYNDYIGALNDLESVITNGLNTARRQAGGGGSQSGASVLKWNPATGKIE